jgi:serine/threonine protein kinase
MAAYQGRPKRLGSGASGEVIQHLDLKYGNGNGKDPKPMARKIFLGDSLDELKKDCAKEFQIMQEVKQSEDSGMRSVVMCIRTGFLEAGFYSYYAGTPFIDFELLDGFNLQDTLDGDGLSSAIPTASVLVHVMFSLLSAVHYIHKKNILHLDIKPLNIMLTKASPTEKRRAVLIDFGHAEKENSVDIPVTFGTNGYQAPEYWKDVKANRKFDVFSLGATFHYLLYGFDAVDRHGMTALEKAVSTAREYAHVSSATRVQRAAYQKASATLKEYMVQAYSRIECPPRTIYRDFKFVVPQEAHALVALMMHPDSAKRPTTAQLLRSDLFPSLWTGNIEQIVHKKLEAQRELHTLQEKHAEVVKELTDLKESQRFFTKNLTDLNASQAEVKTLTEQLAIGKEELRKSRISLEAAEQSKVVVEELRAEVSQLKTALSDVRNNNRSTEVSSAEIVKLREQHAVDMKLIIQRSAQIELLRSSNVALDTMKKDEKIYQGTIAVLEDSLAAKGESVEKLVSDLLQLRAANVELEKTHYDLLQNMANDGEAMVALQKRATDLEKEVTDLRAPPADQQTADEIIWAEYNIPDARSCFPTTSNAATAFVSTAAASNLACNQNSGAKRQKTQHNFKTRELRYVPNEYISEIQRRTSSRLFDINDSDVIWNIFDYAFGTITQKCSPKDPPEYAIGLRRGATQVHETTPAEKWLGAAFLLARDLNGCKQLSVSGAMDFATRRSRHGVETVLREAKKYLENNP